MPRLDTNRAAEMEVFVRVVERGGFTAAARKFRLTASGVSKLVTRLETRLGPGSSTAQPGSCNSPRKVRSSTIAR
jgi:hypothetical protein